MAGYFVYDVFTDKAFSGNPLAVIPHAEHLAEDDLQKIAREFNFSETSFVFPPKNPDHTARVRIFTPTMEIPFAGHPLIGTAIALSDQGYAPEMILELGVGPIHCHATSGRAQFTTQVALQKLAEPTTTEVANALGLSEPDIKTTTHAPVLISVGLPFTLTELSSRAALSRITTQIDAFRQGAKRYAGALDFAQFAYVREGDVIHARMFAPLDNIAEDPATGSACAALAALLSQIDQKDQTLTIHQGDDMGRPSIIHVTTKGAAITIAGAARRVMQGELVY